MYTRSRIDMYIVHMYMYHVTCTYMYLHVQCHMYTCTCTMLYVHVQITMSHIFTCM